MVSAVSTKIGSKVDLLYPSRGYRNVLRRGRGELLEKGKGPNGPAAKRGKGVSLRGTTPVSSLPHAAAAVRTRPSSRRP